MSRVARPIGSLARSALCGASVLAAGHNLGTCKGEFIKDKYRGPCGARRRSSGRRCATVKIRRCDLSTVTVLRDTSVQRRLSQYSRYHSSCNALVAVLAFSTREYGSPNNSFVYQAGPCLLCQLTSRTRNDGRSLHSGESLLSQSSHASSTIYSRVLFSLVYDCVSVDNFYHLPHLG